MLALFDTQRIQDSEKLFGVFVAEGALGGEGKRTRVPCPLWYSPPWSPSHTCLAPVTETKGVSEVM